jgi:hypothetical protein
VGSTGSVIELREVGGEFCHALPEDLRMYWANDEAGAHSLPESAGGGVEAVAFGDDAEGYDSDDDDERDYTACSAEDCGYCGRCRY